MDTTTPIQSGLGSTGKEGDLYTPQISRTGASPSDPEHLFCIQKAYSMPYQQDKRINVLRVLLFEFINIETSD